MKPTDVSIITTYRCQMKCEMCNIWRNGTDPKLEIRPEELEMLPELKFVNLTGGEPFLRDDIAEIVEVTFKKAPRVVISTSGWHTEKILALAEKFPRIGIRVSIEGLSKKNDELRGRTEGFDKGLRTLLGLRKMGVKDIGFGITVSNNNSDDMLWLYELAKNLKMEFATAAFHNSYYFHKDDNQIVNQETVIANFAELIDRLLRENKPKTCSRIRPAMRLRKVAKPIIAAERPILLSPLAKRSAIGAAGSTMLSIVLSIFTTMRNPYPCQTRTY